MLVSILISLRRQLDCTIRYKIKSWYTYAIYVLRDNSFFSIVQINRKTINLTRHLYKLFFNCLVWRRCDFDIGQNVFFLYFVMKDILSSVYCLIWTSFFYNRCYRNFCLKILQEKYANFYCFFAHWISRGANH